MHLRPVPLVALLTGLLTACTSTGQGLSPTTPASTATVGPSSAAATSTAGSTTIEPSSSAATQMPTSVSTTPQSSTSAVTTSRPTSSSRTSTPPRPTPTSTPVSTPRPTQSPPSSPTSKPSTTNTSTRSGIDTSSPRPSPTSNATVTGVPAGLVGLDIERIPTNTKIVALTFDAGANADGLPPILSALQAAGVPATFFLTGRWAENYPGGVRQISASGYRIGNHSTTHPMMTSMTTPAIAAELRTARAEILAAGGTESRPLFRFPYGDRDQRTVQVVNNEGYVAVRWTVDSLGWKGTSGGMTRQAVIDRVLGAAQPGEIVLMHLGSNPDDGSTLDAAALPDIIAALTAQGYRFVTLDALL